MGLGDTIPWLHITFSDFIKGEIAKFKSPYYYTKSCYKTENVSQIYVNFFKVQIIDIHTVPIELIGSMTLNVTGPKLEPLLVPEPDVLPWP